VTPVFRESSSSVSVGLVGRPTFPFFRFVVPSRFVVVAFFFRGYGPGWAELERTRASRLESSTLLLYISPCFAQRPE